jgi:putative protease
MNTAGNRPEVLAPAGDMERLVMALEYGADAVYLAGSRFGMRAAAGNFSDDDMERAAALCRRKNAKVYVACNAVLRNDDLKHLPPFLETIARAGADGVIVTDPGVFAQVRKYAPALKIHVSTQAGIMNAEAAKAWADLGADRVILARELTLSEIAEIRAKTPDTLELEVFVHGSMCVSFPDGACCPII